MSNGYVHTRDDLKEILSNLEFEATALKENPREVIIIGRVGLVLAERLEAIVNVLEDMEKTL